MTITRSSIAWTGLLGLICVSASDGWSQDYPSRPIRYVVPSSAGSGGDYMARIMSEELTQAFGQQIVVDNRAGAAGNLGAETVARSAPDGYTIFQTSITLAINASLYRKLSYDLVRDFAHVTTLVIQPNLLVVHASLPVASVKELVALAKAKPGTLMFGSAGTGTNSFLAGELLKGLAGINMVHVPYKGGGPALVAVIAGETKVYFAPIPPAMPHVQQGRLRALAVSSARRLPSLSEYPTVGETVPGYELENWYGLSVPAKTPKNVIAAIHRTAAGVINKPGVNKRLNELGYVPVADTPAAFDARIKSEIAKMAVLIKQTGATAD